MIRRPLALLTPMLIGAALLAGCGSSSSTTTTSAPASTTPASATSTPTSATSTPTSTGTSSTPAGAPNAAAVAQAVAVCKSVIGRDPALSAAVKAKVEGICNKAANGDLEGARKAGKEVCTEVINASPLPASAKVTALASCNSY